MIRAWIFDKFPLNWSFFGGGGEGGQSCAVDKCHILITPSRAQGVDYSRLEELYGVVCGFLPPNYELCTRRFKEATLKVICHHFLEVSFIVKANVP